MPTDFTSLALPHGAAALPDWGLVRVQGADAASFLQGQLTQDMAALQPGRARLAGYCSPKGRLLASFVAWRSDAETFWLACSADLLPALVKRLSMFVLRAKAKVSDAALPLHGIVGLPADGEPWQVTESQGGTLVRLPDAAGRTRHLWCGAGTPPAEAGLPHGAWALLEVLSAVPRIAAATQEQFVPQMVNLEALDGVNFRKGCYPGQEVVARSQYRGTLKRRGFLFEAPAQAAAGQELFHSDDPGQPAGMVVNAAAFEGAGAVFAEVKIAALASGSLHLGAADGPVLHPLPLPYDLPRDAD